MVSQLINEPGVISVEFSAREVWHIEREQMRSTKISSRLHPLFLQWHLLTGA